MQLFVGAVLAGLAVVPRGVVSQDTSGYRQQEVRYLVPARLDELTGTLSARETTSHDWNFTNNRQRGFLDFGDAKFRWDTFFSEPAARNRKVISIAPTFWWNDASDATVGVRLRSNYMGRYDRTTLWLIRGVSGFEEATSAGEPWKIPAAPRLSPPVTTTRGTVRLEGREGTADFPA